MEWWQDTTKIGECFLCGDDIQKRHMITVMDYVDGEIMVHDSCLKLLIPAMIWNTNKQIKEFIKIVKSQRDETPRSD